ncbi:MAG: LCP family protein [Acetivibrionales bacterium]
MRKNTFVFAFCAALLLAMFTNGLYIIMRNGESGLLLLVSPPRDGETGKRAEYFYGRDNSGTVRELPVNLMVLGLDKDETRCDVIMLFNFDPASSKLNILSVARDTKVYCNSRRARINSLYSKGGENLISEELTAITGLPVHYYITMNFEGFRKIIDTLGGVEFYVPFRMIYDDPTQNLRIRLKKGYQLLDGKKAEQLVRYRKGNYGQGYTEGDIGRIKIQQDFMKALISQKLNIDYISKAGDIFNILKEHVKTNITMADIVYYIGKIKKIESGNVHTFTLPGKSKFIEGAWYYLYDPAQTAALIQDNFSF